MIVEKRCLYVTVLSVMSTVLYDMLLTTESGRLWISAFFPGYNIFTYISSVVLFTVLFSLLYRTRIFYEYIEKNFVFLVFFFLGLFLINNLYESNKGFTLQSLEVGYYKINKFLLIGCVLLTFLLFGVLEKVRLVVIKNFIKLAGVVLVCGMTFYALYVWEYLASNSYQITHNSASFDQIYNCTMGEPFSRTQFGIYGHYGIFYSLLFWIIGFSMKKYAFVQALCGVFIIILFSYCIIKLVRDWRIQVLSIVLLGYVWGAMIQVTHHMNIRSIPAALVFAYIVWCSDSERISFQIKYYLGYFLCSLLILWNFEAGFSAWAAWIFYSIYYEQTHDTKLLVTSVKNTVMGGMAVILSYMLFNIYNLALGGEWQSVRTYVIPYLNGNYMVGSLQMDLMMGNYLWLWLFIAALFFFSIGLSEIIISRAYFWHDVKNATFSALAVFVLCGMTYFANRAHNGCLATVFYPAVVLLGCLTDRILRMERNCCKNMLVRQGIKAVSWVLTIFLCGMVVCGLSDVIYKRSTAKRDNSSYLELVANVSSNVPEGVKGIGHGVDFIYTALGRDTGYHFTSSYGQTEDANKFYEKALLDGTPKVIVSLDVDILVSAGILPDDMWQRLDEIYDVIELGSVDDRRYLYLVSKKVG